MPPVGAGHLEHARGAQTYAMVDVLLHSVLGYPQAEGNLLLRQAINLPQHQHLAAPGGQGGNHPCEQIQLLGGVDGLIRRGPVAVLHHDVVDTRLRQSVERNPTVLTQMLHSHVTSGGKQKSSQRAYRLPLERGHGEQSCVCFLDHVRNIGTVCQRSAQVGAQIGLVRQNLAKPCCFRGRVIPLSGL